jgi:hypothetical protein
MTNDEIAESLVAYITTKPVEEQIEMLMMVFREVDDAIEMIHSPAILQWCIKNGPACVDYVKKYRS